MESIRRLLRPMHLPWVSVQAALLAILAGVAMITDAKSYRPIGAYQYTFQLWGPTTWGKLFIVLGVLFIGGVVSPSWPRRVDIQRALTMVLAGALACLLIMWAFLLLAAKFDPAGTPSSWNGPLVWTFAACAHLTSFSRFGPGHR